MITLAIFQSSPLLFGKSALTYEVNGGRLGDHLFSYCKAKWIEYNYKIPLLYQPFDRSSELMMHTIESNHFNKELIEAYDKIIKIRNTTDNPIDTQANTLYISNIYFSSFNFEHQLFKHMNDFEKEFILQLRKL